MIATLRRASDAISWKSESIGVFSKVMRVPSARSITAIGAAEADS